MELYQAMRTTFAAREFTDEPVPDSVLHKILDNARFAASGGNRQGWRVVVVREASTRQLLASLIGPTFKRYFTQIMAGEAPYNTINASQVTEEQIAATNLPAHHIDNAVNAPVLLLVFVDLRVVASFDKDLDRVGVISGASIYPLVQNILPLSAERRLRRHPHHLRRCGRTGIAEPFGRSGSYGLCCHDPAGATGQAAH